jgi:hypothetical protein
MARNQDSAAVAVARACIDAWSNHDFEKTRKLLAPDVKVLVTTTQGMPDTKSTGAEDYISGLRDNFAKSVERGSAKVLATVGDEHNALVLFTVRASFGPKKVTVPAARLYRVDDNKKITAETVLWYAAEV